MRRRKLKQLRRLSEERRAEWKAAGMPEAGPEREAMIIAFANEGMVRYRKVLRRLAREEQRERAG